MKNYRMIIVFANGNELHAAVEAENSIRAFIIAMKRIADNSDLLEPSFEEVSGDGEVKEIRLDNDTETDPAILAARRNKVFYN